MKIISNKEIDLSNYEASDLQLGNPSAEVLFLQCENITNEKISVLGRMVGADSYSALAIIDNSSYKLSTEIAADGFFCADVSGTDAIKLDVTNASSAKLSIKLVS